MEVVFVAVFVVVSLPASSVKSSDAFDVVCFAPIASPTNMGCNSMASIVMMNNWLIDNTIGSKREEQRERNKIQTDDG